MKVESLGKKLMQGWSWKVTKDPEARAMELIQSTPGDLQEFARQHRGPMPVVKEKLLGWFRRKSIELDAETLDAITRYFQSGSRALDAAAEMRRAKGRR